MGSGWTRLGTVNWNIQELPSHMRQGQGCGKRREAGCRPRAFTSTLTSSLSNTRGETICKALPSCPPPQPPLPSLRQVQKPVFAKQPGALGLFLSGPFGCYGSCSRKTLLPTIQAFLSEPGSEHLAFQSEGGGGRRGRGSRKRRLTTPLPDPDCPQSLPHWSPHPHKEILSLKPSVPLP